MYDKMNLYKLFVLAIIALFSLVPSAIAQHDQQAVAIMEKAMGPLGTEADKLGIYFEGIAFGIAQPKQIFSLPTYQVYRGGFFVADGKKFEIQLGVMKALCDGKLMVIVDENSKTMIVDSLRDKTPGDYNEVPDLGKLMDENFGESVFAYKGKEVINGKSCHKIKAEFPKDTSSHVYYWVQEDNNKLLLIGEWQGSSYDVYWIKKITQAPKDHVYAVNLPKKELEDFYGYQVFDFRYTAEKLQYKEED
jgi:hypothetical protein